MEYNGDPCNVSGGGEGIYWVSIHIFESIYIIECTRTFAFRPSDWPPWIFPANFLVSRQIHALNFGSVGAQFSLPYHTIPLTNDNAKSIDSIALAAV